MHRALAGLIRARVGEPLLGCEVGVWRGELSAALLKQFPALRLLMVDRWAPYSRNEYDYRLSTLAQEDMDAALQRARENTSFASGRRWLIVEDSVAAASLVMDVSLDFVFIDACHTYPAVRNDLFAWWPKVRDNGLLCGHDYGGVGDRRGRYGVRRAVDEFVEAKALHLDVIGNHLIWWFVKE